MESPTTLTIEFRDRFSVLHKREITQAEFETDEAFIQRARAMLAKMREEQS